jgi:protein FRA10AC1
MAKKYYDKLFKEYCIADLSAFKKGKIGLRWRTQQEVFDGRGQFRCGNQACDSTEDLVAHSPHHSIMLQVPGPHTQHHTADAP